MKQYIAVVSSEAGKIAKYQDFDTQAEADAHAVIFGGFVTTPPTGSIAYWTVDTVAKTLTHDDAQEDTDALSGAWASVRQQRNALISATDWRVLPDQPISQPWMDYRQSLRDITNVATPDLVVWPSEPV